jgi:hypothetical protein
VVVQEEESPSRDLPIISEAESSGASAQDLWKQVNDMVTDSQEAQKKADSVKQEAEEHASHAENQTESGKDAIKAAEDAVKKAHGDIKTANSDIKDAKALRKKAHSNKEAGTQTVQKGETALSSASSALAKAEEDKKAADSLKTEAKDLEEKAMEDTASVRTCVDLPGVRLRNWDPRNEFRRVVDPAWYPDMGSREDCLDWCKRHATCQQATFSYVGLKEGESPCRLHTDRGELYDFRDDFNTSWCGSTDGVKGMLKEVEKIFDQKPWVGDNYGTVPCGFGGDDCRETKCCGTQSCDWTFTDCEYFQCIVKDETFAGCTASPDAGWDGEILGGGPPEEDIEKVAEGKLVHPSSLFCFVVFLPGAHGSAGVQQDEGLLLEVARKTNSSIYSCDDQMTIEGYNDGGGSESNINVFIEYWKKVKEDGRYLLHDWLIKADADCVFIADRVRQHVDSFRPPAGAAVYFRNTDYKFHFMGAFEMMSREGAIVYFQNDWKCDAMIGHTGGEDYWMKLCLDTLGLRHITDWSLLNDKYGAHDGCGDSWAAAFHFYKTEEQYMGCLNEIWR